MPEPYVPSSISHPPKAGSLDADRTHSFVERTGGEESETPTCRLSPASPAASSATPLASSACVPLSPPPFLFPDCLTPDTCFVYFSNLQGNATKAGALEMAKQALATPKPVSA